MLRAAITFLVLAIVAVLFGSTGVAGLTMEIAQLLLFVFLALAVVFFIGSIITGKKQKRYH